MFGLTVSDVCLDQAAARRAATRVSALAARLDQSLANRQMALIAGPSGAGKTTLLHALAQSTPPGISHRTVWVHTRRPTDKPTTFRALDFLAHRDKRSLLDSLRSLSACALADIRIVLTPIAHLSEGEWARLALARALVDSRGAPATLLIDEFAASLDDDAAAALAANLRQIVTSSTNLRAVVVTHRLSAITHLRPDVVVRIAPDWLARAARSRA